MLDNDLLKKMIEEQEQVVRMAQEQLNKLYKMAQEVGLFINKRTSIGDKNFDIQREIENQRNQILSKIEKIKEDSMKQVQNAMSSVQSAQGSIGAFGAAMPHSDTSMPSWQSEMMKTFKGGNDGKK